MRLGAHLEGDGVRFGVVSSVVISSAARMPGMPANRLPLSIMTNPF